MLGPVGLPFSGGDVAISDYGDLVAVAGGYDGDLVTYDVATGRRLARLDGLPRPDGVGLWRDTAAVAFNPADDVYLGSMAGPVREVDARTGQVRRTFAAPRLSSHVSVLVMRNDVLVTAGDEALVAVDLTSGRQRWVADLRGPGFSEPCPFFAGRRVLRADLLRHLLRAGRGTRPGHGPADRRPARPAARAASAISSSPVPKPWSSWGSPPVRRRTPAGGSTVRTSSLACASRKRRHPPATTRRRPTSWCRRRTNARPTAHLVPLPA